MEDAAEGDIQFLIAATDRQQRNALLESEADQRQAGGVARRIKGFGLDGCRPAIVAGMHVGRAAGHHDAVERADQRSEEHTSELQSLMRSSYAVFCLKKK